MSGDELKLKLAAITNIIPFLRLLERERLRVSFKTLEEFHAFFASDAVNKIFKEAVADNLALSQIMLLLKEKPMPTGEIAERIGLTPSDVSRYMNSSSRQGLVSYDEGLKSYALA
jgi:predicted transcriptional regulator